MSAVMVPQRVSLIEKLATKFSIDPAKMLSALKATAFKQRDGEVSNEQMIALLVVADQYGLNPWTKEIYAYPDKGSIVPVVGVDGWSRIINDNPNLDGIKFVYSPETVKHKDKTCYQWIECSIYRKDRKEPVTVREYFDEVVRDLKYTSPWDTHPNRMHRHKALIQCARIAFGFGGIYDEDEAERIIDMGAAEIVKITPNAGAGEGMTASQKQPVIDTAAQIKKALTEGREFDAEGLAYSFIEIEQQLYLWSLLNSKERSAIERVHKAQQKAESTVDTEFVAELEAGHLHEISKEQQTDK